MDIYKVLKGDETMMAKVAKRGQVSTSRT